MNDVSELFKAYFKNLNKASTMGHMSKANAREYLNLVRKSKRDTLMNYRRNINEHDSPYITPKSKKPTEKQNTKNENKIKNSTQKNIASKTEVPNKRLELLAKWKAEKQERKKIERKNAKPVFKYYHVTPKPISDISTANKFIKGKPITPSSTTKKTQFAPPNYKFRAPSGIKPLEFNYSTQPIKRAIRKNSADNTIEKNGNKKDKGFTNKSNQNHPKDVVIAGNKNLELEQQKKRNIQKSNGNITCNISNAVQTASSKQSITISNVPNRKNKTTKVAFADSANSSGISSLKQTRTMPHRSCKNFIENYSSEKCNDVNVISTEPGTIENIIGYGNRQRGGIKQIPKKNKMEHFENSSKIINTEKGPFKNDIQTKVTTKLDKISLQSSPQSGFDDVPNSPESAEVLSQSCVPVSPFVTISRGKKSTRQEYTVCDSQGLLNNGMAGPSRLSSSIGSESRAGYFTDKLNMEIERMTSICNQWKTYLNNFEISEEARSSIDVVIGQSRLLMSKKFQQFRGLIDQCRSPNQNQKPITCSDLHGFWDMIYMQVEDLDKRFNNLEKLKENNWEEVLPQKEATVQKVRGRPKKAAATSKLKSIIEAARKKKGRADEQSLKVFDEGYYEVRTPMKQKVAGEPNSARRSMRSSLLVTQSRTPNGSSPGLMMMKISQSIKQGQGLTPAKSILKAEAMKPASKKSVLFKEDKENIPENVRTLTPRRSTRLTKI